MACENPRNSPLFHMGPMKRALEFAQAKKTTTYLGAYGMEITKPVDIWSNARFAPRLQRAKPLPPTPEVLSRYYVANLVGEVTGRPDMELTGAYPVAFGEAVAECYQRSESKIRAEVAMETMSTEAQVADDSDVEVEFYCSED